MSFSPSYQRVLFLDNNFLATLVYHDELQNEHLVCQSPSQSNCRYHYIDIFQTYPDVSCVF
jgi:hypothetical protein